MLPSPLTIPPGPHVRRHGPYGHPYRDYKDWARDDFQFRCVYCLHRETWERDGWRAFQLDHVIPRSIAPDRIDDYENIVYSCRSCNAFKRNVALPDPGEVAYDRLYRFEDDARATALNATGMVLIEILQLNQPRLIEARRRLLCAYRDLCELIDDAEGDLDSLDELGAIEELMTLLGYPLDIPDLRRKRPRGNRKPYGVIDCHFARLQRREIPHLY